MFHQTRQKINISQHIKEDKAISDDSQVMKKLNKEILSMSFSESIIQQVWEKATIVHAYDSRVWRKDRCGAWIGRSYYGDRNSQYGWEVDHIVPVSREGSDELSNLRPLHWENNVATQDGILTCVVRG